MLIKSVRFAPPQPPNPQKKTQKKKEEWDWFTYHTAHFPYTLLYPSVGWCVIN